MRPHLREHQLRSSGMHPRRVFRRRILSCLPINRTRLVRTEAIAQTRTLRPGLGRLNRMHRGTQGHMRRSKADFLRKSRFRDRRRSRRCKPAYRSWILRAWSTDGGRLQPPLLRRPQRDASWRRRRAAPFILPPSGVRNKGGRRNFRMGRNKRRAPHFCSQTGR